MKPVILIDNGHGLSTPGKRSPLMADGRQLLEYKYTREIAREVVGRLKAAGCDARLLVPEDADVSLGQRCMRANAVCDQYGAKNVLLVSVHLNAAGNGAQWCAASGWEAYTSPGVTRADALAESLYASARKWLSPHGFPIRCDTTDGDSDKEARFQILTCTRCPAVLTETLFMDNDRDCRFLLSDEGREAIISLHVEAITAYINQFC